ncbi:MAG: radical SAM protein, partial [Pseudonocardiaceae bacterium]
MTTAVAPPQFLWLEITGRCQLECVHCYADSSPSGTHGTMTARDWCWVIDEAAAVGVRSVQFIGGEPTLHPGLVDLINYALSRALAVEVFSNLVHVTDEHWAAFGQPGVSLATSYYSDDPDEHTAITGRPSHPRTKANIAEAQRRGIPLRVGVIDVGRDQRVEQARA